MQNDSPTTLRGVQRQPLVAVIGAGTDRASDARSGRTERGARRHQGDREWSRRRVPTVIRRPGAALALILTVAFMVVLDFSIVNVLWPPLSVSWTPTPLLFNG